MKSPRSSSPADTASHRRYLWALGAGPVLVVIASGVSAWIAVHSDDGVVADNYYKRGLLVNRTLKTQDRAAESVAAAITTAAEGVVDVQVDGRHPEHLELVIARAGVHPSVENVPLEPVSADHYTGRLRDIGPGVRIVTLRAPGWQLPTTVTDSMARVILPRSTALRSS